MCVLPTRMMPMGVGRRVDPPPYDAEVEYVVNTGGTQYVDTGIAFTLETVVRVLRGDFISHNGNYMVGEGANTGKTRFFWNPTGTVIYARINENNASANASDTLRNVEFGNLYVKDLDTNTMVAQRTKLTTLPKQSTLKIFSGTTGTNGRRDVWQCKRVEIVVGGVTVRDFAPVRVGQTGYLYDRANPTGGPLGNGLYGSATSTPLIAGPDK